MKVVLLDMDSVLLEPHGYHSALVETVRLLSSSLGFEAIHLTPAEIAAFESAGVFSEWDSAAMCAVLLLQEVWKTDPEHRLPLDFSSVVHDPNPSRAPAIAHFQRPDFTAFSRRLALETDNAELPLERASTLLLEHGNHSNASQKETVRHILSTARDLPGSLTHRTFQELVLGSQVFAETYGIPPALNTRSYLLEFDIPLISTDIREAFLAWLDSGGHAAIMTSRPSEPLPGTFSTPEAELGARLVGFNKQVPIVGLGALNWLSQKTGIPSSIYMKPVPLHALAALAVASGLPIDESLLLAASFVEGQVGAFWRQLEAAQIAVFEDNTAGMKSAKGAVKLLAQAGISTRLDLYGITENEAKTEALRAQGATIYPSINIALRQAKII